MTIRHAAGGAGQVDEPTTRPDEEEAGGPGGGGRTGSRWRRPSRD